MNRFHSLAIGTILICALTAPAQQASTAPGAAEKNEHTPPDTQDGMPTVEEQLKVLTIKLDLTADQQAMIKPILQELHDATLKVVQDQSLSHEERLARVRPQRYKAHNQIRAILNDEQNKKLDQYMQGPHPEMHGNLTGATSSPQPPHN
jgi:Spy/CpxP family protein refolding chaperone